MATEQPYGPRAARIYDLIVFGQDDAEADTREVEFIEWAFSEVCRRPVHDVLDAGCGTGAYVVPLARAGYRLTGIDLSEAMLERCRAKLERRGLRAELRQQGMQDLDGLDAFDAVICMGSAICYLLETEEMVAALRRMRQALRPGGLLVVDNDNLLSPDWQVLDEPEGATFVTDELEVEWQTLHRYDDFTSIYHIRDAATVREGGQTWQVETIEHLRAMTAGEMLAYLERAGFAEPRAYPDFSREPQSAKNAEDLVFLALRPES
ncbi:MAG: class I SAM-dependent methyltransferase [Candidatus Brocadiia bacterium]